jgi:hypothetical protein
MVECPSRLLTTAMSAPDEIISDGHVVNLDDAAGARRCGGCAAYASIARPPVPLDSRLVLSLRGQSKVRLLVQPGPPT